MSSSDQLVQPVSLDRQVWLSEVGMKPWVYQSFIRANP
jgi:hypothetical protein